MRMITTAATIEVEPTPPHKMNLGMGKIFLVSSIIGADGYQPVLSAGAEVDSVSAMSTGPEADPSDGVDIPVTFTARREVNRLMLLVAGVEATSSPTF
ncbi:hypothetical protein TSMEX_010088 [Taenia solium]|eukprot:TsM_000574200 transcript=TsM_000574200 gene=TsM_000574200